MQVEILISVLSVIFILVGAISFFAYKFGIAKNQAENVDEQAKQAEIVKNDNLKKLEIAKQLKDEISKKYD